MKKLTLLSILLFGITSLFSQPGAALNFDGNNDGVDLGNITQTDNASQFTFEAWLNPASLVQAQRIFSRLLSSSPHNIYIVTGDNPNPNKLLICWQNCGAGAVSNSPIFANNTWMHLAVVFDGTQTGNANRLKVYKDGVLQTLSFFGTINNTTGTGGNAFLGKNDGCCPAWNGDMDEVRIWNRALSQVEIQANMNCELGAGQCALAAYYQFNQGTAGGNNTGVNTLTDVTGNGYHGTLNTFALTGSTSNWITPGGVTTGSSCPAVIAPEINLQGNSMDIADGDGTPGPGDDHTIFGDVNVNVGTMVRTFTIQNSGTTNLTVSSIAKSGTHQADFTIGALTPAGPIAPGNSATFTVTFDPSGTGLRNATITVNNNDCDEAAYDFAVQGNGIHVTITVAGSAGNSGCTADNSTYVLASICNGKNRYACNQPGGTCNGQIKAIQWDGTKWEMGFIQSGCITDCDWMNTANTPNPPNMGWVPCGSCSGTLTLTGEVSPLPGAALDFDNVNDNVSLGTSLGNFGTGDFTVETWFKTTSSSGSLLGKRPACGISNFWNFLIISGKIQAEVCGGSGANFIFAISPLAYHDGNWHHAAMVRNGTVLKLYMDGALVASNTGSSTANINNAVALNIGDNPCGRFSGSMDEVRIWNTARTCQEISQLRNCELTGNESGLVAYYKFNQGAASGNNAGVTALEDATSNNFDGTLTNFALTGSTSNWATPGGVTTGTSCPAVIAPEINLQGNSMDIADGDATPGPNDDHTIFGNVTVGGNLVRTFTIQNTGTATLTISSITSSNAKFVVSGTPASVAAGNSATFMVTYTPTAATTDNATITVNSNDCDEAAYDFAVTGTSVIPGAALAFDGSNDYIGTSGINIANQSFTIEFWAKRPTVGSGIVVAQGVGGNMVLAGFADASTFVFSFHGGNDLIITNPAFNDAGWHHWACVYYQGISGIDRYVYYDGVLVGSNNATFDYSSSGLFNIGRAADNAAYFNGQVDEVRIWNRPLCQNEIQAQYNCELTGTESGLLAYYKFNHGIAGGSNSSATTLTDFAGGDNNGTLNNFALTGSTSNWIAPGGVTTGTSCAPFMQPEINLQGNSMNIPDGDATPGPGDDHTIFGNVNVGSNLVRTFTIQNTGTATLNISSITSGNAKFVVSGAPASVTMNSSATFTVTYSPTTTTTDNATITVNNDDCDEAAYDFAVTGTGTCVPPSFSACPGTQTANVVPGTCAAPVSYTATATGIPMPDITYSFAGATMGSGYGTGSGSSFNRGSTTVTLTATSSCGSTTCSFSVNVSDNENPVITCPSAATINTDNNLCTSTSSIGTASATDNCTISLGNALHGDGSGDNAVCNVPGSFLGSSQLTIEFWAKNGSSFAFPMDLGFTWQVLFGGGTFQLSGFFLGAFNTGATVSTNGNVWEHFALTYDGAGTWKAYKNGQPTPNPSCTMASCFSNYNSTLTNPQLRLFTGNNGYFYNGALDEVRIWSTERTQAQIAANMYNELGGSETGLKQYFNFNQGVAGGNNTGITTLTATTGNNAPLNSFALNGPTSNFVAGQNIVAIIISDAPAAFPKGNTTVTWTATDGSGNTDVCTQVVTVQDVQKPTISGCPANQSLNVIAETCAANYSIPAPTLSDNCPGPLAWNATFSGNGNGNPANLTGLTDGVATSGISFSKGNTTVTLSTTDAGGNVSTANCTFTVTVTDNEAPVLACPANETLNTAMAFCNQTYAIADPVSDNCSGSTWGYALTGATTGSASGIADGMGSGSLTFQKGVTTVTLSGVDAASNTATACQFTVTVTDNQPPSITCPGNVSVNTAPGQCSNTATWTPPVGTDNCTGQTTSGSHNPGDSFDKEVTMVTYTVTDAAGLSATCSFTVTVTDDEDPMIDCADDVTINTTTGLCTGTTMLVQPATSDNCSENLDRGLDFQSSFVNVPYNAALKPNVALTVEAWFKPAANQETYGHIYSSEDNLSKLYWGVGKQFNWQLNINGNYYAAVNPNPFTAGQWYHVAGTFDGTMLRLYVNGSLVASTAATGSISTTTSSIHIGNELNGWHGNGTMDEFRLWNVARTQAQIQASMKNEIAAQSGLVLYYKFNQGIAGGNNAGETTATDASGNNFTGTLNNFTLNGATDNWVNGLQFPILTNDASATYPKGATTVTWTSTDKSGNMATCNQKVTVLDNQPPTLACPSNQSLNTATGLCTQTYTIADPLSDNCTGATWGYSLSGATIGSASGIADGTGSGSLTFQKGMTTVTLSGTDGSNSAMSCSFTITVSDNEAPVLTCPSNQSLNTAEGFCTQMFTINDPISDNCTGSTWGYTLTGATTGSVSGLADGVGSSTPTFQEGVTTVTLSGIDASSNAATTCQLTVTVTDDEDPNAVCQNITVQLSANGTATITAAQVNNGSSDNCGLGTLIVSPSSFTCENVGANPVTLTVPDVNGNSSTCTATVTVGDDIQPNAFCQNVTVIIDANGQASVTAAQINNGSSDNCSLTLSITDGPTSFDCTDRDQTYTLELTVTDPGNNTDVCTAQVTVSDPNNVCNQAPTAVCQNVTVSADANCQGTAAATAFDDGSSDPDSDVLTFSVSPAGPYSLGTTTVTLTVSDGEFSDDCSATISVIDNTAPVAVCQNVTVALNAAGSAGITAVQVNNGSSDNCGTVNLQSVSPSTFSCSNVGSNTVILTVNDGHGNTASCTATVTMQDNIVPTAVCKNLTVNLNSSGTAVITPAQMNNGSSDNCPLSFSLSKTSFNCTNVGANTVTLTANDGHGNTASCSATVTMQDVTPPAALCKNVTVALNTSGSASVTAAQVNNGSSDACGIQGMSVAPNSFTCANIGGNTVTLTVTDVNSNTSSCSATVTVQDNTAPSAACQNISIQLNSNGSKTITTAQVFISGSDNCGTVTPLSVSPSTFDCSDEGANTVILTVGDGHGNTSTCSATVTVGTFVVITSVVISHETCAGMSNGSITINATTLGGTLIYSINGGGSFQFTNVFSNLTPGTYNIVVMAQGTTGCSDSAVATVNAGGPMQTWYKDSDNDGYSNGTTQQSCSQPAGYKLLNQLAAPPTGSNIDCNDNDALQKPGQVWYKDSDNDNWSNGTTKTQCTRPAGYKTAGEISGNTSGDCNDTNAAIHPGASEICNGIDEDCDGTIDESAPEGTFVGNKTFTTQAQINAWSACYTVIQGNLSIQGSGITSLANLINLVEVTGNVQIKLTGLDNLNGLDNLEEIGGHLTVMQNNAGQVLSSLDGLGGLTSIGGGLNVHNNNSLEDCCAIYDLLNTSGAIGGNVNIHHNKTGCDNVAEINTDCGGGSNLIAPSPGGQAGDAFKTTESLQMEVVPNPSSGNFSVRLQGNFAEGSLLLYDSAGRLVWQQKTDPEMKVYNFESEGINLRSGLHLLVFRLRDGTSISERIVVY